MSSTTFIGIDYGRLLEVVIAHEYYDNAYCPHIALEPSPACQALLRQYRLMFRATPLGGVVIGEVPAVVPLPKPTVSLRLEFYLRMRNTEFLAVTALGKEAEADNGFGAYLYEYQSKTWTKNSGKPLTTAVPNGVIALIRIIAPLVSSKTKQVQLDFQTPKVTWNYYVVADEKYAIPLGIVENGKVVSSTSGGNAQEIARVKGRYKGKKVIPLSVSLKLKRDFPAWFLVADGARAASNHIPDLPPLPKPRPGAPAHLILDYSAILK